MRLAWFRHSSPDGAAPDDDTAHCLHELRRTHAIDLYTADNAHTFVWRHARQPYELCIYELPPAPWHSFMSAYASHYPGLALRPGERPHGWGAADMPPPIQERRHDGTPLRIALLGSEVPEVARDAVQRACAAGASIRMPAEPPGPHSPAVVGADVVLALISPQRGDSLVPVLASLAAGLAVVVYDVEATALWPTLDPQTWRRRGPAAEGNPIAVSIDLRDREHSLALTLRRLEADTSLRRQLGEAARAWWSRHGTLQHAVEEWERLMTAAAAGPPMGGGGADGTAHARATLAQFGSTTDLW